MRLLDLPDELLVLCCDQVDTLAAKALRLSCTRFASLTSKRLYSRLQLLPTAASARKARAVLEDGRLNSLVTAISIQASLEDVDENLKPDWDVPVWRKHYPEYAEGVEHGIETNGVLAPEFKAVVDDVGRFRNLRRVEVKHDHVARGAEWSNEERESVEYREAFLKHVIRGLNHSDHPALQVDSLSICNLQNLTYHNVVQSDDFKAVLSRLRSLQLGIITEEHPSAPENEMNFPERHIFFGRDLLEHWLKPVQQKLVHLKLYSNCYWGYLPKCDLRGLHFPHLKSLAFGNMTFSHDWQLDWIVSHGGSLESLTLDDCPIIHDALTGQEIDAERYYILGDNVRLDQDCDHQFPWSYASRWHHYFRALRTGLPHLRHFGIGHGPWESLWEGVQLSAAFETAASLPAELLWSRYVVFDWGTGPSPWIEPEDWEGRDVPVNLNELYDLYWEDDDIGPNPSYPDCAGEDKKALDELVAAVEERRSGK